jgi:SAM-dependent methyltransferase
MLEELTEDVFRRAGLRPGMRVLDLGCGVGDVSLLAARMVGAQGSVLGVDRAVSSVQTATRRAASLRVANASFETAELTTFEPQQSFDAIVGRLVLLYLPDPAAILRRLSPALRRGGVVAFQEYDMSQVSQVPAGDLFLRVKEWLLAAFAAGGAELDMGTRLYATFLRAGLPPPSMTAATPVACGPSSPGYESVAGVVRSLLPLIEREGIASAAEIDIDTLTDRLREDSVARERVTFLPRVVGAWTSIATGP